MPNELEIMLKGYEYLRQEVQNSTNWQNRIFISAATIVSVLLALGLTQTETLRFSAIMIPPAVTALTAFWLVEQTRMMRAGDYMKLLEDQINIRVGVASILWENWLCRKNTSWRELNRIHYISQYLGSIGVFYIISGFSIWNAITLSLLPWGVSALYIAILFFMLILIFLVIPHRPEKKEVFEEWKEKYCTETLQEDILLTNQKT